MGFSFEEIEQIQRRPDTKVRAGDVLKTDDPTNPNYETSGDAAIISRISFKSVQTEIWHRT